MYKLKMFGLVLLFLRIKDLSRSVWFSKYEENYCLTKVNLRSNSDWFIDQEMFAEWLQRVILTYILTAHINAPYQE